MDVNDRGTKKWTSLMLPEHVEALENVFEVRKEKPIIDEQQQAENGLKLQEALEFDSLIRIEYFVDHDYQTHEGYLLHVDVLNRKVYMEEMELIFDDIIEVTIL